MPYLTVPYVIIVVSKVVSVSSHHHTYIYIYIHDFTHHVDTMDPTHRTSMERDIALSSFNMACRALLAVLGLEAS